MGLSTDFIFESESDMTAVSNEILSTSVRYLNLCRNKNSICQEQIGIMYIENLEDLKEKINAYSEKNPECKECENLKKMANIAIMKFRKALHDFYSTDPLTSTRKSIIGGKHYSRRYKNKNKKSKRISRRKKTRRSYKK